MAEAPPEFPKLDSNRPEFWDARYAASFTPWEHSGVPQLAQAFAHRAHALPSAEGRAPRVLVPGCGGGLEVACFASVGWDVIGIDFSEAALATARRRQPAQASRLMYADFFAYNPAQTFDGVYERTFLCALKPDLRQAYAARMAQLIHPGGRLFGFFYYDDKRGGPPFALAPAELDALFAGEFERVEAQQVTDSIAIFDGKERWEVWQRVTH